jgi:hypothetical protein
LLSNPPPWDLFQRSQEGPTQAGLRGENIFFFLMNCKNTMAPKGHPRPPEAAHGFRDRPQVAVDRATNASSMATVGTEGKVAPRAIAFGINLPSVVILVSGCSYAPVPLYQLHCQASGSGGTVQKGS